MHLAKCLFLEAFNTVEFPFLLSARSSKRTSIILILHKISKYGTHMCPLTKNVVKDFFLKDYWGEFVSNQALNSRCHD